MGDLEESRTVIDAESPLGELQTIIQRLAQSLEDEPIMVDVSLVIWEQVAVSPDGEVFRKIQYALPSDNFSPAVALGLVQAGLRIISKDLFGDG